MIIAVDFDGTCVTHEFPYVGREIGAARVLKRMTEAGHKLILWTMRSDDRPDGSQPLADAVAWFAKHEIPLFGIQRNPEQDAWTCSPKAYAELYIDDAAFGAPLLHCVESMKPFIDWTEIEKYFFP